MTTETRDDRTVVVKRADDADGIARLEHEARVLAAAAHPGVVSVVTVERGDGAVELVTALAGTRALDPADADALAVVAALAATVADLHQVGVVHGRIDPSHVVVAGDGQPVLCGFGEARLLGKGGQTAPDVRALGALLLQVADATKDAGLARRLRPVADRAASGIPSARSVAAALQPLVAPLTERRVLPDRRLLLAGAAGVVLLVVVALVVLAGEDGGAARAASPSSSTSTSSATSSSTTPPTTAEPELVWPPPGGEPVIVEANGGRYEVGQPGDQVAVGDWDCDGTATPALLRPSTGAVFVFTSWSDAIVEPSARLAGATDIRAADADGDGCADVVVDTPSGPEVVS